MEKEGNQEFDRTAEIDGREDGERRKGEKKYLHQIPGDVQGERGRGEIKWREETED